MFLFVLCEKVGRFCLSMFIHLELLLLIVRFCRCCSFLLLIEDCMVDVYLSEVGFIDCMIHGIDDYLMCKCLSMLFVVRVGCLIDWSQ